MSQERTPRDGGPSFSLWHRLFRAIWNIVWLLLASWTPPPFHAWRRSLLRLFGAKIADSARIYGSTRIWYPPNLVMGHNAVLGWQSLCYNQGVVTLKAYAVVSQRAHLCAGTHDIDSADHALITKPITVEKYAWVAADAFVGPGVVLEEGAVLGARGVAFRSLAAWRVYAGNPAREIRCRTEIHIMP